MTKTVIWWVIVARMAAEPLRFRKHDLRPRDVVTTAAIRIAAWLIVMTIAIPRRF